MKKKNSRKILISVGVAALLVMSVLTAAMVGVSGETGAPAIEEGDSETREEDPMMNLEELLKDMNMDPTEPVDQLDVMDPEITQLLSGGNFDEGLTSSGGMELMTDEHTMDQHHVGAVHDMGIYGDGVQVSLMDTGFDMAHPDLIGTHAVFEYDENTMDEEMEMYDGYPIAFDPVSMADYAYDGEISQDYESWWGTIDNSWYVDTSFTTTTYEKEGDIYADFGPKEENTTYTMPDGVEAGELVRFGLHPDEKLHSWYGERPAVLLTQDEYGDWNNVYVDLLNNRVFEKESGAWIDGENPESEMITKDLNEDGIADVSGGMLYFVADGEKPIPYSQNFRETMNKIINLGMGYPPGTIGEMMEDYEDAWHYLTGQDEIHTMPGDGEMIALMGDFNEFGSMGAHGTWTASAVAGQGVTGVPQEMIIEENVTTPYPPTPGGSEGLPRGLSPNATIIPMGRFFDPLPADNPLGQVPTTYSSVFFTADGYTGDPTITCDSADIASSSFGRTIDENHGGFNFFERLFDYVGTQYTQNTLFINSMGNSGSGFGTVTAPSGAQGLLSVGATGNQMYRVDPWRKDDGGPNPWYGEVTGMSSIGPHSKGSHGPDIMTNGQFGYGADPVNQQLANIGGFQGNNSWTLWSGTSLSAPNAAGIAALVYQAYEEAHGEAPDAYALKNIIMQGADDINNSPHLQGPGEANAYNSVKIAQGEGLYSEEFQWRPGTNPEMGEHVEHHVNMMEAGESQTDEMTLHNWNENDDIDYEMNAYKQEKVGNTSIELSSGMGGPHGDGRVPLIMINETGVYELMYNETNDNWDISDYPIATLDDPDADLFRFGTHTPYENHDWWDYSLAEFYNWEDVNDNGSFDGWEERNRIGYTFASLRAVGLELTSDYFTIHDAMERAEDGILLQMNNIYHDFMGEELEFTLNVEQYNQVEWDWIEIDDASGTIPAGDTLEYEITANVPEETIKGIYGGKLMIEDVTNERTHPVPITITVGEETNDLSEPMHFAAAEGEDDHGIYRNDRLFGSWDGGLTGDWRFYAVHLNEPTDMPVEVTLDFDNEMSDMSAYLLGGAEHDVLELGMPEDPFSDPTWNMQDRYGVNTLETMAGDHYDYGDSVSFVTEEPLKAGTYMIVVQSHQISGHEPYQEFSGELSELSVDYMEIEPLDETLIVGKNVTYTATAYNETYDKAIDVTEQTYWEIDEEAGGEWDQETGTYESEYPGEWTVNASYEHSGEYYNESTTLYVGVIDYLVIEPEDHTVTANESVEYTALAYNDTFGELEDVTEYTEWYTYEEDHSEYWEDNVYTPKTAGEWTINASYEYEGVYYIESTSLTVEPAEVYEVVIDPDESQTITAGETIDFTAEAYDEYENLITDDVTDFEWTYIRNFNETANVAIFDQAIAGDYNVSATYGGVSSDNITVTVEKAGVDEVIIDPYEDQEIIEGETIQFYAEAYADGELITDYAEDFVWENATDGWFEEEPGIYEVTATFEDVTSDVTTVTVLEAPYFEVEITAPEDGSEFSRGEEITIEYTVTNTGEVEATQDIIFYLLRIRERRYGLTLQGGEVYEGEFTWEATLSPGKYTINVWSNDHDDQVDITIIEEYELTINIEGEGTTDPVEGTHTYEEGTEVTVQATPEEGWKFVEWTGDYDPYKYIGTEEEITIIMDEDKELTAHFEEIAEYELTINIEGEGTTDPAEGTYIYEEGTEVSVEAIPDEGWYFLEWTGDVTSTDSMIEITMDNDKEITAHFEEYDPAYFEVEITDYDDEVEEGDTVTVEFTVENTGELEGTQTIVFSVNGDEEDTMEMTIGAGESEDGEFTWEAEDEGDYELEVASDDTSDSVTVTVEEEEVEVPGFTTMFLMLSAVIAVAIYYKKKQ